MHYRIAVPALMILLPLGANSQEAPQYHCTNGQLERRVEIVYPQAPEQVPCEVHYHKDTEQPGVRQVLWQASNEPGYCEYKAQEFAARLESWGWSCRHEPAEEAAEDRDSASAEAGPQE